MMGGGAVVGYWWVGEVVVSWTVSGRSDWTVCGMYGTMVWSFRATIH